MFQNIIEGENNKKRLLRDLRGSVLAKQAYLEINEDYNWFRNGTLKGDDIRGADLQEAMLHFANLQGTALNDANLQGTALNDANLEGAELIDANLQGAELMDANLEGAVVANFDPLRTQLDEKTILPNGSNYDPAKGLEQLEQFGVTVTKSHEEYDAWRKKHGKVSIFSLIEFR